MCTVEVKKDVASICIIEDCFDKSLLIEYFFSSNSPRFHVNVLRNVTSVLLLLQTFQQVSINNALVAILF